MRDNNVIYRLYDDHEEKHYVCSSLDHQELEKIVEVYKSQKENVYASEFVKYLHEYDPSAEEVEVKDFYF